VGNDALLPTQITISRVGKIKSRGGKVKKKRRYRAEPYLTHPLQKSCRHPFRIPYHTVAHTQSINTHTRARTHARTHTHTHDIQKNIHKIIHIQIYIKMWSWRKVCMNAVLVQLIQVQQVYFVNYLLNCRNSFKLL